MRKTRQSIRFVAFESRFRVELGVASSRIENFFLFFLGRRVCWVCVSACDGVTPFSRRHTGKVRNEIINFGAAKIDGSGNGRKENVATVRMHTTTLTRGKYIYFGIFCVPDANNWMCSISTFVPTNFIESLHRFVRQQHTKRTEQKKMFTKLRVNTSDQRMAADYGISNIHFVACVCVAFINRSCSRGLLNWCKIVGDDNNELNYFFVGVSEQQQTPFRVVVKLKINDFYVETKERAQPKAVRYDMISDHHQHRRLVSQSHTKQNRKRQKNGARLRK